MSLNLDSEKYKTDVNIFLLCYNEEILISETINHYKYCLPNCKITILDNHSTDKSVDIARKNGCTIISWGETEEIDDYKYTELKNNIWKNINNGWIIVCDMDEWLCVTTDQLEKEKENKTTFLGTYGYHMVSNSKCPLLSDINLHSINEGVYWRFKPMCFLRPEIKETNFNIGISSHNIKGQLKKSSKKYFFKHMGGYMGYEFYKNKTINRHLRRKSKTPANHYTNNIKKIKKNYSEMFKKKVTINVIENSFFFFKKKILITYSCYNPPNCLIESIQSLYDLQITNEYDYKIICIDNGSDILTTYDVIKKRFPFVEIIYANNKNFEYGAYKYALNNFPNFDIYVCLQDTIIIKKRIDLNPIKKNWIYLFYERSGFHRHSTIRKGESYNRLMKNINLDVDDIIDSWFNIACYCIFIIIKSDLHDLFETLTNPPIKKIDTNFYERLFGMYFIKKKFKTINIENNIKKILRHERKYNKKN